MTAQLLTSGDDTTVVANATNDTSLTLLKPPNTAKGDLLLAIVCFQTTGTSGQIGAPDGWRALSPPFTGSQRPVGLFALAVPDAAALAALPASWTWTNPNGTGRRIGQVMRVLDADLSSPGDDVSGWAGHLYDSATDSRLVAVDGGTIERADTLRLAIAYTNTATQTGVPDVSLPAGWSVAAEVRSNPDIGASTGANTTVVLARATDPAAAGTVDGVLFRFATPPPSNAYGHQVGLAPTRNVKAPPLVLSAPSTSLTGRTLVLGAPGTAPDTTKPLVVAAAGRATAGVTLGVASVKPLAVAAAGSSAASAALGVLAPRTLAPSADGRSAAAVDLTVGSPRTLAPAAAGAAAVSPALGIKPPISLAPAAAGAASVAAVLTASRALAAAAAGQGAVVVDVGRRRPLSVAAAGQGAASADLGLLRALSVAAEGTSAVSVDARRLVGLTASAAGAALVAPVGLQTYLGLAVTAAGLATFAVDIPPIKLLAVTATGRATVSGRVAVEAPGAFTVYADGRSGVAIDATRGKHLTVTADATSAAVVELGRIRPFDVAAAGQADAGVAVLGRVRPLEVLAAGRGDVAAVLGYLRDLTVAADGAATASAVLDTFRTWLWFAPLVGFEGDVLAGDLIDPAGGVVQLRLEGVWDGTAVVPLDLDATETL